MSPLLLHPQTNHILSLNITMCHNVLGKDKKVFLIYYFVSLVGLGFGLPFVLMTTSYSCIVAWLLAKGRCYGQVVHVLALVLLVFILCFTPSNVRLFIHYMLKATGCTNITYIWYALALVLSAFNNCFNPFVYFYVSPEFSGLSPGCRQLLPGGGLKTLVGRVLEKAALPLRSSKQSQL